MIVTASMNPRQPSTPFRGSGWRCICCHLHIYGPENIPSGFEPGFDPWLAHYSNVTHIHGLFGSALQNTYISCLGHDDASSVSFVWANACAVLPRPVSGF